MATKVAAKKTVKKSAPKTGAPEKLRIKVQAYESTILDLSVKQIIDTASRLAAKVRGPIPLPTHFKSFTVNRGPFIDKDSREQFEIRTHARLIDIESPTPKVIEALTNIDLPAGVSIDVKML
jgi:small subunit ribosomal protein S10